MKRVLVAYFSASGTTAQKAKTMAEAIGADCYEIAPATPYTRADLDWTNPRSRSSVEMADKSFRPALKNVAAPIAEYDEIYLLFPIWWYVAPTIINSFLESYNFDGKRIVLFATSGGSGFGRTREELAKSVGKGATIVEGGMLNAARTAEDLRRICAKL